jgi:hypothetical protein
MIGFATYLEHGDTLEMHYIGMDYKFNNEYNIYFNMLFDGVKHAIEKKKKLLELGRTAREAKASLGAQAVYFNDYIFIKGGFTRFLVNKLGNDFNNQMGGEWRDRMPFKDS